MNEILNLPCVQFSCSLELISYFFFMNGIFLQIVNFCFFFKEISKKLFKMSNNSNSWYTWDILQYLNLNLVSVLAIVYSHQKYQLSQSQIYFCLDISLFSSTYITNPVNITRMEAKQIQFLSHPTSIFLPFSFI